MELFDSFDISECVLDFMHSYMLMYRGNGKYKEYEGVYFWINHGILRRKSIEEKKHFLEMLFIDKNHIDFICQGEAKFKFDYIGFNHKNMIAKYAIAMKCLTFLEANPSQYYENYVNIKSVSSIIEKSSPYLIDIQLVPGKPKYIAIEYAVGETLEKTIDDLLKYKLIDESLAKKILSHDYLEYKDQFVIKFRWEDENNYTIKLYAEKKHV
jgi:hypothetical protein